MIDGWIVVLSHWGRNFNDGLILVLLCVCVCVCVCVFKREKRWERAIIKSDEDWNCFRGNVGETSERWSGAHNYGLFWVHNTILNWTEERERERERELVQSETVSILASCLTYSNIGWEAEAPNGDIRSHCCLRKYVSFDILFHWCWCSQQDVVPWGRPQPLLVLHQGCLSSTRPAKLHHQHWQHREHQVSCG